MKNMTRRGFLKVAGAGAAVAGLGLVGCGGGSGSAATTGAASGEAAGGDVAGKTVAFIPKITGNAFFESANDGAQKYAKDWGFTVDYLGSSSASASDQVGIINQAVANGVDALCISTVDAAGVSDALKKATDAGTVVTTWDSDAQPEDRTLMVSQGTPEILGQMLVDMSVDGLKQRGAVATFLMVGERVSEVSDVLPRMVNEGHELGNHTMNHPMCHLTGLGVDDIRSQIDDATNAIKDIAGQAPQVLRPVGGGVNSDVKAVAAELGYPIINWSVDTQDWKYRDAAHVKQVIVEQAGDGDVVLMHDLYPTSVQGALDAIDELQKRTDKTYAFVTVSQLAAIHGITLEPGVVYNGLSDKVAQEIKDGTFNELIEKLMQKPIEEMQELYNHRDIEK